MRAAVFEKFQGPITIQNINDPNEIVLGYFDAATVSEQRIFISRGQLPSFRVPDRFHWCMDSIVSGGLIPAMMEEMWVLVSEADSEGPFPLYLMSTNPCVDCTLYGTNEKPEYW